MDSIPIQAMESSEKQTTANIKHKLSGYSSCLQRSKFRHVAPWKTEKNGICFKSSIIFHRMEVLHYIFTSDRSGSHGFAEFTGKKKIYMMTNNKMHSIVKRLSASKS